MMLKPFIIVGVVIEVAAGSAIGAMALLQQGVALESDTMRIWRDVWGVLGPLLTLGVGGLITFYLQRLAKSQDRAATAATDAASNASAAAINASRAAANAGVAAKVAQASAKTISADGAARDTKLEEMTATTKAQGETTQVLAVEAKVAAEDASSVTRESLGVARQTHEIVNSQRTAMEKLIADLRQELREARGQPTASDAVIGRMPDASSGMAPAPDVESGKE